MPKSTPSPFDRSLFQFLGELGLNNEREWFEANRERYEASVREPALDFIRALGPHMKKISPHIRVSDKKVGGSLMRVYRDTRFSKDKTPYKTNVGLHFRHEAGKDVHAPGFYLHIEPDEVFLGVGMWHPDAPSLAAVRKSIVDDPKTWKRVRDGKKFNESWALGGESLKRAPKGFDPDHPMIEDLRRKDFIASTQLKVGSVTKAGFLETVVDHFKAAKAFAAWQAKALDLAF